MGGATHLSANCHPFEHKEKVTSYVSDTPPMDNGLTSYSEI